MLNKNITRSQISQHLRKKFKFSDYLSKQIIDEIFWMMRDNLLLENRIEIRGFGVFNIVERKSKIGRNPKNPKKNVIIPIKKKVKFVQSSTINI